MVAEVFGGISAFKAMFDMAKSLKDINDTAVRNGAIVELQEQILGAQVAQAALLERVNYLEKEVARFEEWEIQKQRYELKEIGRGAFVYALKEHPEPTEPPHFLCANCFQKGQIAILQTETRFPGRCEVLMCISLDMI